MQNIYCNQYFHSLYPSYPIKVQSNPSNTVPAEDWDYLHFEIICTFPFDLQLLCCKSWPLLHCRLPFMSLLFQWKLTNSPRWRLCLLLPRRPAKSSAAGWEHALLQISAEGDGLHHLRQPGLSGGTAPALSTWESRVSSSPKASNPSGLQIPAASNSHNMYKRASIYTGSHLHKPYLVHLKTQLRSLGQQEAKHYVSLWAFFTSVHLLCDLRTVSTVWTLQ